jgi:hypothetical protein
MNNIPRNSKFNSLFPLDESLSIDFLSKLYRGCGYVGRSLTKFYGFQTLWLRHSDNAFIPVGTLVAKQYGFFKEKEKGVFTFNAGRIGWTREKYALVWKPSAYQDYEFRYGFTLRFLHFGKASLSVGNDFLCSFHYPLKGPSSWQAKDCVGFFKMRNGAKIHFLVNSASYPPIYSNENFYMHRGNFYLSPQINESPLFPQSEELSEFISLKKEARILLVILALKARLFSVYH